jgi:hypothetical protein
VVSITFSLYNGQTGGEPLWTETQNNVQLDPTGHYSVQLGITKPAGVPTTLFTSGEARWLGVQIAQQPELPRMLLLSVPYALKAGDAATIGGLPPSAFVLAAPSSGAASTYITEAVTGQTAPPPTATDVTTTGGTVNYLPVFNGTSTIIDSVVFQSATSPFKIGINTATPATTLDVKGAGTIRGTLSLPATGTATATKGANSQPLNLVASAFNSTSSTAVNQTFQWQAEPASNDTTTPSGSLNLLFGVGATKPSETGLRIASNGQINFATGQTFPGIGTVTSIGSGAGLTGGPITSSGTLSIATGGVSNAMLANSSLTLTAGGGMTGGGSVPLGGTTTLGLKACGANQVLQYLGGAWTCSNAGAGTITGVTAGTDLTGGGASGTVTLNLDTTKVPQLAAANTFTGTQTITGNLALPHANSAGTQGVISFGGVPFVYDYGISGSYNAFFGFSAGNLTNTGKYLTAVGDYALVGNSSGLENTAVGYSAGAVNTLGSGNTFVGFNANAGLNNLSNATAIGANAVVSQINSLVLGGTGASAVSVGIGTATPAYTLDVEGQGASNLATVGAIGFNAPSGSGGSGGYGVFASGGNGDGTASTVDGSGGYFTGGDTSSGLGDGIFANAGSGYAGAFAGDLSVSGAITASTKDFKIDHPLDPANKYLFHASVESSDMKNIYDGTVTTDSQGDATVQLPVWFEVLNTDFRYQLTAIGQFAQAIVSSEVANHQFSIKTDKPNVKVSWQITGVRQDAYAKAHPLVVEQEKDARERGHYIHPELYGASEQQSVDWARHPEMMKRMQETRARQLAASQK